MQGQGQGQGQSYPPQHQHQHQHSPPLSHRGHPHAPYQQHHHHHHHQPQIQYFPTYQNSSFDAPQFPFFPPAAEPSPPVASPPGETDAGEDAEPFSPLAGAREILLPPQFAKKAGQAFSDTSIYFYGLVGRVQEKGQVYNRACVVTQAQVLVLSTDGVVKRAVGINEIVSLHAAKGDHKTGQVYFSVRGGYNMLLHFGEAQGEFLGVLSCGKRLVPKKVEMVSFRRLIRYSSLKCPKGEQKEKTVTRRARTHSVSTTPPPPNPQYSTLPSPQNSHRSNGSTQQPAGRTSIADSWGKGSSPPPVPLIPLPKAAHHFAFVDRKASAKKLGPRGLSAMSASTMTSSSITTGRSEEASSQSSHDDTTNTTAAPPALSLSRPAQPRKQSLAQAVAAVLVDNPNTLSPRMTTPRKFPLASPRGGSPRGLGKFGSDSTFKDDEPEQDVSCRDGITSPLHPTPKHSRSPRREVEGETEGDGGMHSHSSPRTPQGLAEFPEEDEPLASPRISQAVEASPRPIEKTPRTPKGLVEEDVMREQSPRTPKGLVEEGGGDVVRTEQSPRTPKGLVEISVNSEMSATCLAETDVPREASPCTSDLAMGNTLPGEVEKTPDSTPEKRPGFSVGEDVEVAVSLPGATWAALWVPCRIIRIGMIGGVAGEARVVAVHLTSDTLDLAVAVPGEQDLFHIATTDLRRPDPCNHDSCPQLCLSSCWCQDGFREWRMGSESLRTDGLLEEASGGGLSEHCDSISNEGHGHDYSAPDGLLLPLPRHSL